MATLIVSRIPVRREVWFGSGARVYVPEGDRAITQNNLVIDLCSHRGMEYKQSNGGAADHFYFLSEEDDVDVAGVLVELLELELLSELLLSEPLLSELLLSELLLSPELPLSDLPSDEDSLDSFLDSEPLPPAVPPFDLP